MSNFKALDKDGRAIEFAADGDGTTDIPFVPHHKVMGSVAVSNLPATQQVAGTVQVSNLPATQQVAGMVGVNNFPATQQISFLDAALITESPLTAVGSTPTRDAAGYKYFTYQVDATGIGTNAVVRVEGNLTGANYINLNPSNVDTTLTQNKSYLFTFEGKISNIRFTLVSFSGGAPNLTCHLLKGN